jgi:membrane-associated phospholipid phosphatase
VHHRISLLNRLFKLLTYVATGGTCGLRSRPYLPGGRGAADSGRPLAAVVVWGADGIASLLKVVTHRPRPFASMLNVSGLIAHPRSSSFPSAHATTAFAGAGVAALAVAVRADRFRSAGDSDRVFPACISACITQATCSAELRLVLPSGCR